MSIMSHFSEGDWVDFVRGLSPVDEDRMSAHLGECESCAELVSALRTVAGLFLRDAVDTPRPNTLHAAHAIFSMWTPDRVRLFSPAAAQLVFDSFAMPAIAGIRSGQAMYRQLLYEATPYAIDLRLDQQRGEQRVSLAGQVASVDATRPVAGVRVTLSSDAGGRVIEQIRTNAAGEFYFDYLPAPRLQLRVDVESSPQIDLPSDIHGSDGTDEFGRE